MSDSVAANIGDPRHEAKDFAGRKNHPDNPNENPDPYLGGLPISTLQDQRINIYRDGKMVAANIRIGQLELIGYSAHLTVKDPHPGADLPTRESLHKKAKQKLHEYVEQSQEPDSTAFEAGKVNGAQNLYQLIKDHISRRHHILRELENRLNLEPNTRSIAVQSRLLKEVIGLLREEVEI